MTKNLAYILGSLAYYYREHEYMEKLWVRESEFSNLLNMALEASSKSDKKTMLYEYADYFIGYTCVFLLLSNSDITSLLSRIKNQKNVHCLWGCIFLNR